MSSSHSFANAACNDNAIWVQVGKGEYNMGKTLEEQDEALKRAAKHLYSGEYSYPSKAYLSIGPRKRYGRTLPLARFGAMDNDVAPWKPLLLHDNGLQSWRSLNFAKSGTQH